MAWTKLTTPLIVIFCVLTRETGKLLEHIICKHILDHLEKNSILTSLNHGFRRGYSCESQLLSTTHDLLQHNDSRSQIDVIILDFSKAFDTVPHDSLLHKMKLYGIDGNINNWLRDFLTNRTMRVVVDGETSEPVTVDSGVPQGTVLGPLAFLCHINDLPDCVKSTVRLFADDCLLYRNIKTIQDQIQLQEDLKALENWATTWGMRFNAKKCYVMSINSKLNHFYELNSHILQQVDENPYLGVTFADNLKFDSHINKITNKANSTLGFLRRNLKHCPLSCRKTAYLSLIRSTLEYSAAVWDPYLQKDIDKLERVQRRSARFISGDYSSRDQGCVSRMLRNLQLPPLQDRRKNARLTYFFKVVEGLVPAMPCHAYLTPISVSQVQISVNPPQVVLGSLSPVSTTFTCTLSDSISDVFTMQFSRKRETDIDFVVVGQVKVQDPNNADFHPSAPQDIVSRGAMSGSIDINTPSSSTLTLTMSTQDVVCTDKGEYQCSVGYFDAKGKVTTAQSNGSLSIYGLPYEVSMSARKNNVIIQGASPGDGAAIVNVGETVEFTCSAKIGSDNTTRLRWKRTSEFGAGNFIPYQQQEDIDDGTSSSMEIDCSYTRTATLRYNVTLSDANRNNDLAFQCYVSVDPPGQGTVETQNPPTFYINAINPDVAPNQDKSIDGDGGTNTAAIIGGVVGGLAFVVLIVVLACYLYMRRGSSGESYRTKEETGEQNPNMVSGAPVDQTYAVPNKEKKKGHENRGLDERHTNRSRDDDNGYTGRRSRDHYDDIDDDHHYNNNSRYSRDRVGGRANRALDHDDDYSRDGSPTINHMGLDPESGSYGTGV